MQAIYATAFREPQGFKNQKLQPLFDFTQRLAVFGMKKRGSWKSFYCWIGRELQPRSEKFFQHFIQIRRTCLQWVWKRAKNSLWGYIRSLIVIITFIMIIFIIADWQQISVSVLTGLHHSGKVSAGWFFFYFHYWRALLPRKFYGNHLCEI